MSKSPHDSQPTTALAEPKIPRAVEKDGVTREYLERHHNLLTVMIPHYAGQTVGDSIGLSIGGPGVRPLVYKKVDHAQGDTKVEVAAIQLERVGSGTHAMFYTITPPSGPEGPASYATFLKIHLGT